MPMTKAETRAIKNLAKMFGTPKSFFMKKGRKGGKGKGRGWHGDSAGHARAAKSRGRKKKR